jgi:hypothetical protein
MRSNLLALSLLKLEHHLQVLVKREDGATSSATSSRSEQS